MHYPTFQVGQYKLTIGISILCNLQILGLYIYEVFTVFWGNSILLKSGNDMFISYDAIRTIFEGILEENQAQGHDTTELYEEMQKLLAAMSPRKKI